jgi:hypothetical protein
VLITEGGDVVGISYENDKLKKEVKSLNMQVPSVAVCAYFTITVV